MELFRKDSGNFLKVDKEMAELSCKRDVHYIFPVTLLCHEKDCAAMATDVPGGVMVFDHGHLGGADYLVSLFKEDPASDSIGK